MGLQPLPAHLHEFLEIGIGHVGAYPGKFLENRQAAERYVGVRISSLVGGQQPAGAQILRGRRDARGHPPVGFAGAQHSAERIHRAGIEPGSDHEELGPEAMQCRQHHLVENPEIGVMARARRQRNIQIGSRAFAGSDHMEIPRVDRVAPLLVDRQREHRGVIDECALRAVAMMHIPVDDRDAAQAVLALGVADHEHEIAEYAVAAARGRFGVMARRAHQCVGVAHPSAEHGIGSLQTSARGEHRDLVAARADGDAVSERAAVRRRQCPHLVDIAGGVKVKELLALGRARLDADQVIGDAADLEEREQPPLGGGRLGVAVGLHVLIGARKAGAAPGVVPEISLVGDQARRASRCVARCAVHEWPLDVALRSE